MDQTSMLYLILLLPCLLLSAFFSSSEAAFLSLRKVRIRHLVESRIVGAERVARMVDQPEKVLPTILLGNNLVNTAFAALTTVIMIAVVGEGRGIIVATVASHGRPATDTLFPSQFSPGFFAFRQRRCLTTELSD